MEEVKQHVCGVCYRQFTYNYTLMKHLREKHPSEATPIKEKKGILCPLCSSKVGTTDFYVEHLLQEHDIVLEKEKLEFKSLQEFYEWKKGIESNHRYVQSRGGRTHLNGFSVTVYECHRSGMYVSRGEGKRKLKNQGSKKINGLCPAKIKASASEKGMVRVEFIKTHVGHDSGEEHILLNQEERKIIAEMIKTKAPFDIIIDNLKKRPDASKRLQAVTKKDLHNIVCSYKLKDFVQISTKRTKKLRPEESSEVNNLTEATPTEILTEKQEVTPDVLFFPADQNIIILGLTESNYTEELSFEKEKNRIKNGFLSMLDSLNSREQLDALKHALSPFLPNVLSHPLHLTNNHTDITYNFSNFKLLS